MRNILYLGQTETSDLYYLRMCCNVPNVAYLILSTDTFAGVRSLSSGFRLPPPHSISCLKPRYNPINHTY